MKIAIGYNTSHYAWMFRSSLIQRLVSLGHEVVVIAPKDEYSEKFSNLGASFIHLPIRMNNNPFSDILIFFRFLNILKSENIRIYLGYTVKPNIYGSLAAHILKIKVINNIAGLGSVFINKSALTSIVEFLYKISLRKSSCVFFQNIDDLNFFINKKIVTYSNIGLLPGSGVDLSKYFPTESSGKNSNFSFLLIARALRDKGIIEYIEAAKLVKATNKRAVFKLLGPVDVNNPSAISKDQVNKWVSQGIIEYLGVSQDVRCEIADSDCVVLPSYREGTPRTLLEAAAMGKPLITTNTAGCRDVVDHDVNGYLCNVKDHCDLAKQMFKMLSLSKKELMLMGENSRKKVESEYDENIVLDKYLSVIRTL